MRCRECRNGSLVALLFYAMEEAERKFQNTIRDYRMLDGVRTVVVGVSGGADSVCLLTLLCRYRERLMNRSRNKETGCAAEPDYQEPFQIEVVHIHHGLRETAERDAEFVRGLCEAYQLPFHLFRENIRALADEAKISCEEAGRLRRYERFREVLSKTCGQEQRGVIAVAHHADDRAETMLLHLFRGSGLQGLVGIEPVNGEVMRPLLFVTRKEIEVLLHKEQIAYVTDETNLSDAYTRNKIRNHVLSYIKEEINPGVIQNMCSTAEQLSEAECYLKKQTEAAYQTALIFAGERKVVFDTNKLSDLDPILAKRVLYEGIAYAAGGKKDIACENVLAVYGLLHKGGTSYANLPYHLMAKREYHRLTIQCAEAAADKEFSDSLTLSFEVLDKFDLDKIPSGPYTKWFDYDKICEAFTVRTRKPGDYVTIDRELQRQSLKRYFINERIPAELRDRVPLLADGSHIMWVVGHRISEFYKVNQETRRVLVAAVQHTEA